MAMAFIALLAVVGALATPHGHVKRLHQKAVSYDDNCVVPRFYAPGTEPWYSLLEEGNVDESYIREHLKLTCPRHVQSLYQLMKDVSDVFTENKIVYWISDGTLLGAVRHKGLIPWDDDLDIAMDVKYADRMLALNSVFNEMGYTVIKSPQPFGFKIFLTEGEVITPIDDDAPKEFRYPFLDVMVKKEEDGEYVAAWKDFWPKCTYPADTVFPLQNLDFGPLSLPAPKTPEGFLERCYGTEYMTVVYKGKDHEKYQKLSSKNSKNIEFAALPADYKEAAKPKESLEETS